jgi:hypothetical protein
MFEAFDFAGWAELAQRDPEGFEAARRVAVEALITRLGTGTQLRRLQWRVDAERQRAKVPLKSCLAISDMMWTAFVEMHSLLVGLIEVAQNGGHKKRTLLVHSALVIAFPEKPPE